MLNKFLAYGEERHALEAVMRMHSVKRWHMIDTTRMQTLAEHSANTAMLVLLILRELTELNDGRVTDAGIVCAALVHDIEESFTGDLPSHTKQQLRAQGADFAEIEEKVIPAKFQVHIGRDMKLLIKLCDLADGIRFVRLHGVDITARHAQQGLEDQFRDKLVEAEQFWTEDQIKFIRGTLRFYAYENS